MKEDLTLSPIGYVKVAESFPGESPRQPNYSNSSGGYIELNSGEGLEQALLGLSHFTHLWVIFQFHQNKNWKPLVQPPRTNVGKKGVFATRAPYRPNSLGLSVVELNQIIGRKIYFKKHDFLNQTPVFDIKPYIPQYDSLPEANTGWIEEQEEYSIQWSLHSSTQSQWLQENQLNLENVVHTQLSYDPTDEQRKRITKISEDTFRLAFRTWRILFKLMVLEKRVSIQEIQSGYSEEELLNDDDIYKDKNLHRQFIKQYS